MRIVDHYTAEEEKTESEVCLWQVQPYRFLEKDLEGKGDTEKEVSGRLLP